MYQGQFVFTQIMSWSIHRRKRFADASLYTICGLLTPRCSRIYRYFNHLQIGNTKRNQSIGISN